MTAKAATDGLNLVHPWLVWTSSGSFSSFSAHPVILVPISFGARILRNAIPFQGFIQHRSLRRKYCVF